MNGEETERLADALVLRIRRELGEPYKMPAAMVDIIRKETQHGTHVLYQTHVGYRPYSLLASFELRTDGSMVVFWRNANGENLWQQHFTP